MDLAIEVKGLVKHYKDAGINAVDHLNLEVKKGEIYGLLGLNGAGKTTTISMICGILTPTAGEIKVNDHNLNQHFEKIKREIGVVPQELALYPVLNTYQNLMFFGQMYDIPKVELKKRIDYYLHRFGLENYAKRPLNTYSGGMKRKVHLIAGILHDPKCLFLDEPTVGIDIQSRRQILDFLEEINQKGTTLVYTSHNMEEAEKLCTRVGILHQGQMVKEGTPADLINLSEGHSKLESILLHLEEKGAVDL